MKPLSSPDCVPPLWRNHLSFLWDNKAVEPISEFLTQELNREKIIAPDQRFWFEALNYKGPNDIKVVILGQDPYHGFGQAHGLSFSVPRGVKIPPSLVNIFKELQSDLGFEIPHHGDLSAWAAQGVLMLNAALSVRLDEPLSHSGKGWEVLTDAIIKSVNQSNNPTVFLLWGAQAQKKAGLIDNKNHLILMAPHPSPLSVYRGFWGSKPFSKANDFLKARGIDPVDWSLRP
jgi:uracil-DNA glycosylase